jgi:hypothetical protein
MKFAKTIHTIFLFAGLFSVAQSQGLERNEELKEFDFLVGKWQAFEKVVSNGDTTVYGPSTLTIMKGFDGVSVIENWEIKNQDKLLFKAVLHRIFDGQSRNWILSYSDSGLNYQTWEGKKENGTWQFYRERIKDGKKIIVRQRWINDSPTQAFQVIERSFDLGATWVLGSISEYKRVN